MTTTLSTDDNNVRRVAFLRIIDGDTFVGRVETWRVVAETELAERHIRVHGWNAAELHEDEGPLMRDRFADLLQHARRITVRAAGRSFERVVCDVWTDDVLFAGLMNIHLQTLRQHGLVAFTKLAPPHGA